MGHRIIFNEIKDKLLVKGICEKCGKKRSRTVSDSQTINPYNKNKDGLLKTRLEIQEELFKSVLKQKEELKKHFMCTTCLPELPDN